MAESSRKRRARHPPVAAPVHEDLPVQLDSHRFRDIQAQDRYHNNLMARPILPERSVVLGPSQFDAFRDELYRRNWHRQLSCLPDGAIDEPIVKEFYANIYDPEGGLSIKQCKVRGQTIHFDAAALNTFLQTPVNLQEDEDYPPYIHFMRSHPDWTAIATKLCIPGGHFIMKPGGEVGKIVRNDMTTLTQTWSTFAFSNLCPTSHTSDLNFDKARLVYAIQMQLDMDVGSYISSQISAMAQSNTRQLGFPALITALCAEKWVVSDTRVFRSLSPVIDLAYIRKNCWNWLDTTMRLPEVANRRNREGAGPSRRQNRPPVVPPPADPQPQYVTLEEHNRFAASMLQRTDSLYAGQLAIMENMRRLSLQQPLMTPEEMAAQINWPGDTPHFFGGGGSSHGNAEDMEAAAADEEGEPVQSQWSPWP